MAEKKTGFHTEQLQRNIYFGLLRQSKMFMQKESSCITCFYDFLHSSVCFAMAVLLDPASQCHGGLITLESILSGYQTISCSNYDKTSCFQKFFPIFSWNNFQVSIRCRNRVRIFIPTQTSCQRHSQNLHDGCLSWYCVAYGWKITSRLLLDRLWKVR